MGLLKQFFSKKQKNSFELETQRTLIVDGEEVELDQEAVKFLDTYDHNIEAAQAGIGDAQLVVGKALKDFADYYWYGMNRIDEANDWLKKAADQGYGAAYTQLGMYYYSDRYEHLDYEKAISLFRKAEELGDAEGVYQIGYSYKNGYGVEKDVYEAFSYFLKAAELGQGDAMEEAGIAYYEGNVVEEDKDKAFKFLSNAYIKCEYHLKPFYYYLAKCYMQGEGTEKCPEKAVEVLKKGSRHNISRKCDDGINMLIYCYENGIGTAVDMKEASELKRKVRESEKLWDDIISMMSDDNAE